MAGRLKKVLSFYFGKCWELYTWQKQNVYKKLNYPFFHGSCARIGKGTQNHVKFISANLIYLLTSSLEFYRL